MDTRAQGCSASRMSMNQTPQRRPYFSRTASFADGTDSPLRVLQECLAEIDRREPAVGAFTVIDAASATGAAHASAARWRAGRPLSAIDGMPVGVKDMIDTADMVTGMGSPLFDSYRPLFDAASVQGLRESGAVIVGKTVTTEFASSHPRGTRNPWDPMRTPGGSSSGSAAAVGCGMLCGGLGTQVVGSIVRPAGFCGAYGFKPSLGGINRGGSLDYLSQSVTGTIAASLADAWAMARAIADRVGGDPGYPGLTGPLTLPPSRRPARLALLRTAGWPILAAPARASLEAALARLSAAGTTVLMPEECPALAATEAAIADALEITMGINAWEWRWPLGSFVARDASMMSPASLERHARSNAMTQANYAALLARRDTARTAYAALTTEVDAVISVTAPGAAPVGLETTGNPIFAAPGSMLGAPGVSLPVLDDAGLPLGLQVLGFPQADVDLFAVACWIEKTLRE
jgi:Asp-tRNA(Asn)/Glu-tRNA(Gln) amidotransferase A subunit family amidase